MTPFTGFVVYLLLWWLSLFVVLPIGTRTDPEGDPEAGGWRGTPVKVNLGWKLLGTTLLAGAIWLGVWYLVESDWISFRTGYFSLPSD